MTATVSAPAPVCAVFLRSSGTGEVLINRKATLISCVDVATARRRAMEILSEAAREHGSALTAVCSDPEGLYRLTIDPDGRVSEAERDSHPARKTSIPPGYATVRAHTPPPALRRPAP
ncbi:MAG: hypothetical protein LBE83_00340, partial [Propionibacteriaceae bacterium]|nr:hypothetical protein [Propionibacteriaceae bacterium]